MTLCDGRCGLCHARGIQQTKRILRFPQAEKKFAYECSHCGMLYDDLRAAVSPADLVTEGNSASCVPDQVTGFDIFTLRILAARFGFAARPFDAGQSEALSNPHSSLAGAATLSALTNLPAAPLTLGVMCREGELPLVLAKIGLVADQITECIVVVDQSKSWRRDLVTPEKVRLFGRQLDRNFGAQRNYIQSVSRTDWVLQLDADEDLTAGSINKLRRLATLAQEQDVVSIGIPRKNVVGTVWSDLYPDIQYRLNRNTVHYAGAVHERPDRRWQSSMIAVGCDIGHRLDPAHVRHRSHDYEKISPGNGRLEEEQALATPFQD